MYFKLNTLKKIKQLYHEAIIVNLLETELFNAQLVKELDDTIYDLVDYCYRKLNHQIEL